MDSSRPSHLIEVHAGNTSHTYTAYMGIIVYNVLENYRKTCNVSLFHLLCRFNGLYKLYQDAVQLPGAVLMSES